MSAVTSVAPPPSVGVRVRKRFLKSSLPGLLPIVLGLVAWQVFGSSTSTTFPEPSTWWTAVRALDDEGILMPGLGRTVATFAVSLLIATILGAAIGAAIGANRTVDRALAPLMDIFRALPPPVIVPVAGLVLGATFHMGVTIVVLAVIWPIVLNTASSMRGIPDVRREMSRTLGLTQRDRLTKIVLPSLLPGIALGMRLAVPIALIVTLLVDILGAGDGIGRVLQLQQQTYNAAGVYGLLTIVGLFGYVVNTAVTVAERRLVRNWRSGS